MCPCVCVCVCVRALLEGQQKHEHHVDDDEQHHDEEHHHLLCFGGQVAAQHSIQEAHPLPAPPPSAAAAARHQSPRLLLCLHRTASPPPPPLPQHRASTPHRFAASSALSVAVVSGCCPPPLSSSFSCHLGDVLRRRGLPVGAECPMTAGGGSARRLLLSFPLLSFTDLAVLLLLPPHWCLLRIKGKDASSLWIPAPLLSSSPFTAVCARLLPLRLRPLIPRVWLLHQKHLLKWCSLIAPTTRMNRFSFFPLLPLLLPSVPTLEWQAANQNARRFSTSWIPEWFREGPSNTPTPHPPRGEEAVWGWAGPGGRGPE